MAALNYLLVVLGFCGLFRTSASEACTTVLFGTMTQHGRQLESIVLHKGMKKELITINSGCKAVGVQVTVCDDVSPIVVVHNTTFAAVERLGSLLYPGYVSAIGYCNTVYEPFIVSPGARLHDESYIMPENV